MGTGSLTVDRMATVAIIGNTIPTIWLKRIKYKNGKPNTPAVVILGDIVYWYRPKEVRDESTGAFLRYEKKFKADKLQRSYQQFADQFGYTKSQAKSAVDVLCKLGVVTREFRDIESGGRIFNNVMYVDLDVDKLIEITAVVQKAKDTPPSTECRRVPQQNEGAPLMEYGRVLQQNEGSPPMELGTNTKNTTKITTDTLVDNHIDGNEEISAYERHIKSQIEYDILCEQLPPWEKDLVDEIIEIIIETLVVPCESYRIGKRYVRYNLLKSRLMKLRKEHIEYILEAMNTSTTKVTDMKAYIIAALYNAPSTMNLHGARAANIQRKKDILEMND